MRDTQLYQAVLGLEKPWTVNRVDLSTEKQQVDVWVEHSEGERWPCPECGELLGLYDHAAERQWRHLDTCQFVTYLHAKPPRVDCPKHGVRQVKLPWAEQKSRFTAMFERFAIDVLSECNVVGAARILRISWDEAWHLMERAVARGRRRKQLRAPKKIGVDEKAIARRHRYFTLVCDLEHGTVEYIGDGRSQGSLDGFFQSLPPVQLNDIEAIALDMWAPYIDSVKAYVPDAEQKMVFDKFHIVRHVVKAVDTVRKQEHRQLQAQGDDTLKGSKYLWLYTGNNIPESKLETFEEMREAVVKTSRAWAIKESLAQFWSYATPAWAQRFWNKWYFWATHSRLKPIIEAARTIQRHIDNVLTYFTHRITNATSEGLNSKIQKVKQMACGFRNDQHFRTAIFFHCGGLELYPAAATHSNV